MLLFIRFRSVRIGGCQDTRSEHSFRCVGTPGCVTCVRRHGRFVIANRTGHRHGTTLSFCRCRLVAWHVNELVMGNYNRTYPIWAYRTLGIITELWVYALGYGLGRAEQDASWRRRLLPAVLRLRQNDQTQTTGRSLKLSCEQALMNRLVCVERTCWNTLGATANRTGASVSPCA